MLCPTNILQIVSDIQWLGFPWNPGMKVTYPRYHVPSGDCQNLHPMVHLGGRYYLSTSSGYLETNSGPLEVSPLSIYHFPCNKTFKGMKSGLSRCPEVLEINLPIFTQENIEYVSWRASDDHVLNLHHNSLKISPPITINTNITKELQKLYHLYDERLTTELKSAYQKIDNITANDTAISFNEILLYLVAAFAFLNTIIIIIFLCCCCRFWYTSQNQQK